MLMLFCQPEEALSGGGGTRGIRCYCVCRASGFHRFRCRMTWWWGWAIDGALQRILLQVQQYHACANAEFAV